MIVSPVMSEHHQHANIEIHCHAEGLPRPVVEWQFNDEPVEQGEKYYIHTCKFLFRYLQIFFYICQKIGLNISNKLPPYIYLLEMLIKTDFWRK